MDAAMNSHLRADGLAPAMGWWPSLPDRGNEDVPNNRSDPSHLARGITIDARAGYECPCQCTAWEPQHRTVAGLVEGDQGGQMGLVERDAHLCKGSVGSQCLVW